MSPEKVSDGPALWFGKGFVSSEEGTAGSSAAVVPVVAEVPVTVHPNAGGIFGVDRAGLAPQPVVVPGMLVT